MIQESAIKKNQVKRICTSRFPTHAEARKILKQLKTNPEVCDECNIKPCTMALYLFGKKNI